MRFFAWCTEISLPVLTDGFQMTLPNQTMCSTGCIPVVFLLLSVRSLCDVSLALR